MPVLVAESTGPRRSLERPQVGRRDLDGLLRIASAILVRRMIDLPETNSFASQGDRITRCKMRFVRRLLLGHAFESSDCPTGSRNVKFVVIIDRDEDGVWIVECPSIPGCVSRGAGSNLRKTQCSGWEGQGRSTARTSCRPRLSKREGSTTCSIPAVPRGPPMGASLCGINWGWRSPTTVKPGRRPASRSCGWESGTTSTSRRRPCGLPRETLPSRTIDGTWSTAETGPTTWSTPPAPTESAGKSTRGAPFTAEPMPRTSFSFPARCACTTSTSRWVKTAGRRGRGKSIWRPAGTSSH